MNIFFRVVPVFSILLASQQFAIAQPHPPVILDARIVDCAPIDEICGDGIDQDCDGADAACPGGDADWDGAPTGADCNDADRNIYPGVQVACSASCGAGVQTCNANGTYSSCECAPLCEAKGGGRCYYISKQNGNDSNSGTFAQPLKTTKRLSSYYCTGGDCPGDSAPANRIALRPGDVVYFMSGLYDDVVKYHADDIAGLVVVDVKGTEAAPIQFKAYPGQHPVISPAGQYSGMYFLRTDHILIDGFEITRAWHHGLRLVETNGVEVRNMWIHDVDGIDNDNIGGISSQNDNNLNIHHNRIHDAYDRTNADTSGNKTENSRDIVLFQGGKIRIHHNVIFQTPPTSAAKTGSCLTYKHPASIPGATFEIDHNAFSNCFFHAIGTSSHSAHIHHNLIVNSDQSIMMKQFGGPAELHDSIIEYNTIIGGTGFSVFPSQVDRGTFGRHTFRNNIVSHSGSYSLDIGGIITVDPYGDNASFDQAVPQLSFNGNCYYNSSQTPKFGLYPVNSKSDNSKGGLFGFSEWQSNGLDGNSRVADPRLNAVLQPTEPACTGAGRYAGE